MTIASATVLLQQRFSRFGAPFIEIGAKSSIGATEFDFARNGNVFWAVSNIVVPAPTYPSTAPTVRLGEPFVDVTTKSTINASEFDYVRLGEPFWVKYIAPAPGGYDTTQFFMVM